MEAWVVSDSDNLTDRIRKALDQLDIDCPLSHILSVSAVRQSAAISAKEGELVFFAVRSIAPDFIELVRQIRSQSDATLVVVSSVSDHASVLGVIRAGAADFLNIEGNLDEEIAEFASRTATQRSRQAPQGRLISVVPCHAPSDASILAANMSAVVAKHVGSCCLLDFHLRGGDLALLLKLTPRHTLYDLISQHQSIDEVMFQQALAPHPAGIRLLAGPKLFTDLQRIQPHICQEILEAAVSSHPFVIVNSEDVQHTEQIQALASSDQVVVTMRMDLVSLHRAQRHIEFLTQHHVAADHLHVVAMGTGHEGELSVASVKKLLRVSTVHCIPDDPVGITVSINVGNPIVLEAPKSKAARAITEFTSLLTGWSGTANGEAKRRRFSSLKAAAIVTLNAVPFCK